MKVRIRLTGGMAIIAHLVCGCARGRHQWLKLVSPARTMFVCRYCAKSVGPFSTYE